MPSETSALSWKTGDCRSRGLAAPVKLPSESEVISSCSESLELATQDVTRHGATTDGKRHKNNHTLHYCRFYYYCVLNVFRGGGGVRRLHKQFVGQNEIGRPLPNNSRDRWCEKSLRRIVIKNEFPRVRKSHVIHCNVIVGQIID